MGAEFLLAKVREKIERTLKIGRPIRRILVGDLRSLRSHLDPTGLRRAIATLPPLLRRIQAPLILFETAPKVTGDVQQPLVVDGANVLIQVESENQNFTEQVIFSDLEAGSKKALNIKTTRRRA